MNLETLDLLPVLSLLRIHNPNCEHCNIRDTHWVEVKKRLEELR